MKRAFTLLELLIVVAIIAILAGLLFPVVGRVRWEAQKASCINNERQLGMSLTEYRQEKGKWPSWSERDFTNDPPQWDYCDSSLSLVELHPDYMTDVSIFSCPANDFEVQVADMTQGNTAMAGPPAVVLDEDGNPRTKELRFNTSFEVNLTNDPGYVIDPRVSHNPWPHRPVLGDGPDLGIERHDWFRISHIPRPGRYVPFVPADHLNHGTGVVLLYADGHTEFVKALQDVRVVNPHLDPNSMGHDAAGLPLDAEATDVYQDDAFDYNPATGMAIYEGDTKGDCHLGTYVDCFDPNVKDVPLFPPDTGFYTAYFLNVSPATAMGSCGPYDYYGKYSFPQDVDVNEPPDEYVGPPKPYPPPFFDPNLP